MATLDEIRTEILETAGLASDDARFPDATLTRIVNRALRNISAEHDWPWNQKSVVESTYLDLLSFDYTGGPVEDEWNKIAHGLTLNDVIQFTSKGTGADEFTTGVDYFVAGTVTADAFQLSATRGGDVLEGTADSLGVWVGQRKTISLRADEAKTLRLQYENRDLEEYQPQDAARYSELEGPPRGYYIEEDKIHLIPTPTTTTTITHVYSAYETALSADSDTPALPDRYIDWLVSMCLVQVATRIRDMDLYSVVDRERRRWTKIAADEQRRTSGTLKIKARSDWYI